MNLRIHSLVRREFENIFGNLKISLGLHPLKIFKFPRTFSKIPLVKRVFTCKFRQKNEFLTQISAFKEGGKIDDLREFMIKNSHENL